jgi:hypothetical protein
VPPQVLAGAQTVLVVPGGFLDPIIAAQDEGVVEEGIHARELIEGGVSLLEELAVVCVRRRRHIPCVLGECVDGVAEPGPVLHLKIKVIVDLG